MKKPPRVSPCLLPTLALPVLSRRRVVRPVAFLTTIGVTGPTVAGIWLDTRRIE